MAAIFSTLFAELYLGPRLNLPNQSDESEVLKVRRVPLKADL